MRRKFIGEQASTGARATALRDRARTGLSPAHRRVRRAVCGLFLVCVAVAPSSAVALNPQPLPPGHASQFLPPDPCHGGCG